MNTFESSLLTELRGFVAERPHDAPAPRRSRAWWGWAAVPAAAVAATGALLLSSSSASAYSVERTSDGDIVVTIEKLSDATGLENALRADGIDAHVDYSVVPVPPPSGAGLVTSGTGTSRGLDSVGGPEDGAGPADSCGLPGPIRLSVATDAVTFRIPAASVSTDATLYITTSGSAESGLSGMQIRWQC